MAEQEIYGWRLVDQSSRLLAVADGPIDAWRVFRPEVRPELPRSGLWPNDAKPQVAASENQQFNAKTDRLTNVEPDVIDKSQLFSSTQLFCSG